MLLNLHTLKSTSIDFKIGAAKSCNGASWWWLGHSWTFFIQTWPMQEENCSPYDFALYHSLRQQWTYIDHLSLTVIIFPSAIVSKNFRDLKARNELWLSSFNTFITLNRRFNSGLGKKDIGVLERPPLRNQKNCWWQMVLSSGVHTFGEDT